jgi:hypothetical protein
MKKCSARFPSSDAPGQRARQVRRFERASRGRARGDTTSRKTTSGARRPRPTACVVTRGGKFSGKSPNPRVFDAAMPFHKRTTTRQGSSSPAHIPLKMAPKTAKKSTFVVDCSKPGASRVRTAIPARSRRRGVFLGFLRLRASARRPETRDVPRRGSRDALCRGRPTSLGARVSCSTPVMPSRPPSRALAAPKDPRAGRRLLAPNPTNPTSSAGRPLRQISLID